jgi:hypothetical protein
MKTIKIKKPTEPGRYQLVFCSTANACLKQRSKCNYVGSLNSTELGYYQFVFSSTFKTVCDTAVCVLCWITEFLQSMFVNILCHHYVIYITFYAHQAWIQKITCVYTLFMCVRSEFHHVWQWLLWFLTMTNWMFWHCISTIFCIPVIKTLLQHFLFASLLLSSFSFHLCKQYVCKLNYLYKRYIFVKIIY